MNSTTDSVLERAQKNIKNWYTYWDENILDFQRKVLFVVGGRQWNVGREVRAGSEEGSFYGNSDEPDQKVINKLYVYVKQMVGENRKNTPEVKLLPRWGGNSQLEKVYEGLIREIAYNSDSDIAIQTAFQNGLLGFGAIGVEHKKGKHGGKLEVIGFRNPENAIFDPMAVKPTKKDGKFCGYCHNVLRKELEEKYKITDINPLYVSDRMQNFDSEVGAETIPVWEYFEKEKKDEVTVIKHYRLISDHILETTEFPGEMLPLVLSCGDNNYYDGKERTRSFVQDAIEPQRLLNYFLGEIVKQVRASTSAKFIVTDRMISKHVDEWIKESPSQRALICELDQGMLPQQIDGNAVSPMMLELYREAEMQIKQALGLFESNLGQESNEKSGVAILNRAKQGQSNVFVYFDNLNRGIAQLGKIIANAIPRVYVEPRNVFIRSAEGARQMVGINDASSFDTENNMQQFDDYEVEISVGSSFEIQRTEKYARLLQFQQANPNYSAAIAPVALKYLDINEGAEIQKSYEQQQAASSQQGQQQQQMQQSMMQMQMQMEQQRLQMEQIRTQADAFYKRMTAGAKMMDSQVNAEKAETSGLVEAAKLHTEMKKAEMELAGDQLRYMKEVATPIQTK